MIASLVCLHVFLSLPAPRAESRRESNPPGATAATPGPTAGDPCLSYWQSVTGPGRSSDVVEALAVYDDGTGPALYAGGTFRRIGVISAANLARFDGTAWSVEGLNITGSLGLICFPLPGCFPAGPHVYSLATFNDGDGDQLLVGGNFTSAGGRRAGSIAAYDGQTFDTLRGGLDAKLYRHPESLGAGADVLALSPAMVNGQPGFVAGGHFRGPAPVGAWDGQAWDHPDWNRAWLGPIDAVAEFDDGHGPAVFAAGRLRDEEYNIIGLLKWDGAQWSNLPSAGGRFSELVVFDDGSGPSLYGAGCCFLDASGDPLGGVLRLQGDQWSAIETDWDMTVRDLLVLDDGTGPALFVAGWISAKGADESYPLAKWDGQDWTVFPAGPWVHGDTNAAAVFDDGSGPALYIGGSFRNEESENIGTVYRLTQPEGQCP